MRYLSFTRNNSAGWGRVDGDTVVDLSAHAADLKTAIGNGLLGQKLDGPQIGRVDVALLPVIPNPEKILCVGHNYEAHRVETSQITPS